MEALEWERATGCEKVFPPNRPLSSSDHSRTKDQQDSHVDMGAVQQQIG